MPAHALMADPADRSWIRDALPRLLRPRSVAIIGASAAPGSFGDSLLTNLERAGYRGELYLVNPKHNQIRGRACLASADELPEHVDCAVLAVPRGAVLEAVAACARRRVGSAIVFSAGFAETGPEGRAAQDQLARIARESRMVIEGPNCLGLVNSVDGIPLTFVITPPQAAGERRRVAILSQSGALAAVLNVGLRHHGLGVSYSISTGNEAVTGIEDYLEYLIGDEHTRVIALFAEHFRRPREFLAAAARCARAGKHIVLLHPGKTGAARASAATHTGALAGDYAVMRSKVEHAGVIVVDTLEELLDCSNLLSRCPSRPQGATAILAESGAFKALALDFCEAVGLPLPELCDFTSRQLREVLPDFIAPSNPLDLTAHALVDPGLYRRTLPLIIGDNIYGSVTLAIILTDESTCALKFPPILDALGSLRSPKPIVFAGMDEGAPVPRVWIDRLHALAVPFFPTPERALRALARVSLRAPERDAEGADPAELALELEAGVFPEYRSKEILRRLGIPVPPGALARTRDQACEIARRIGYPVALKAQSAELSHKSDAGGVALNLPDEATLRTAWDRIEDSAAGGRRLDGMLVEAMARPGVELIVGGRNDSEWGPVLLVGLGGTQAEAMNDVRLLPAGASADRVIQELGKLKGAALLRGFRGSPPLDVESAARIVCRLGAFLLAHPTVREVDLNPVILHPAGRGATAVDALIVVGQ